MLTRLIALLSVSALTACGGDQTAAAPAPTPTANADNNDHGEAKHLGELEVAGHKLSLTSYGKVAAGTESAFGVHAVDAAADLGELNVYLWVESRDGTQLSAPAKGSAEGDGLHFHVHPRADAPTPYRAVLRVRTGDTDDRGSLPLDGHGHEHPEGPHDGVPAKFSGGDTNGHLELKLHDDKGDLELWLCRDGNYEQPFDVPLDSAIEIEFFDLGSQKVTLRPRDGDRNEDEDGHPNVRNGATNYFIYPSRDGEDASWLQGKGFQSIVVVRFSAGGVDYASEEFVLTPHTH